VVCFRLIDAKRAQHPVFLLCSVLGVSRAGYYAWKQRPASPRAMRDAQLSEQIGQIHAESQGTYGWPRVHAELGHRGVRVGRKRIARLMRQAGLSGLVRRRKGKTTIRVPGIATAPDLVRRDFAPTAPNRLWVADLTEFATWEGKLYLAVVSTPSAAAALAGRWPSRCAPSSSSTPWRWRSGIGAPTRGWCTTATEAASTCR
jgi:putative transposase